jgi:hypothetical protein
MFHDRVMAVGQKVHSHANSDSGTCTGYFLRKWGGKKVAARWQHARKTDKTPLALLVEARVHEVYALGRAVRLDASLLRRQGHLIAQSF